MAKEQRQRDAVLFAELGEQIRAAMGRLKVPGVAVGVLVDGQEFADGFGVTNVNHPLPVHDRTLFQIGSITKTFFAFAAMRLAEQGKLSLDVPIRRYLPELRLADEQVAQVLTLRHVFTHTCGFEGDYFGDFGRGDDALARVVANLSTLPQLVPPGTRYSYNNAGFYLAGRVIEVVTGQPFEKAMRELVLAPLGLVHACFFAEEAITERVAVGHRLTDDQLVVAKPWALTRANLPAGGISADVRDLLRYMRFQIGDGMAASGERLLSESSMRLLRTPQEYGGNDDIACTGVRGISWMLLDVAGERTIRHSGGTNGQKSLFLFVPARRWGICILTNADDGAVLNTDILRWALERYLGLASVQSQPIAASPELIAALCGRYENIAETIEIFSRDGELYMRITDKGGFPAPDTPPLHPPLESRLSPVAPDRALVLDLPYKGNQIEFFSGSDGAIAWLRTSRLHKKIG